MALSDTTDGNRVLRLVLRRCNLNLVEIQREFVTVQYWGRTGLGDLRPFFKIEALARKGISVVLIDRKRESGTFRESDQYLYGDPFGSWQAFRARWQQRHVEEPDDWIAAPGTWSGFAWKGIKPNSIPWMALKLVWRREQRYACLNCDEPTIVVSFGYPSIGMFNREPRLYHACGPCRRCFLDRSVPDVNAWLLANLDRAVWPDFDLVWNRPVPWSSLG